MEEIWKDVYYNGVKTGRKISNLGNMVMGSGRICMLSDNGAGYLTYAVCSYKDERGKWKSVRNYAHRLVATYFLPNPLGLSQVNHIDCDKSNNSVGNLEWSSGSSNIDHAHKMGRMTNRTENGEIDILTAKQVIELYVAVKRDGEGISKKAREMGMPRTTASSIINKRSRGLITDKIDSYLEHSNTVVGGPLPCLEELGFSNKSKLIRVQKKASSGSSSGVLGVYKIKVDKEDRYWMALWDCNGSTKQKYFKIAKYGNEEAFRLACEYRAAMIEQLNSQGAGYTDTHGKRNSQT